MQCIEPLLIFAERLQTHSLTKFGIFCRLCVRMACAGTSPHRFYWMKLCAGGIESKTSVAAATDRAHRVDGRTGTHDMAHKSNTPWPVVAVFSSYIYICCCALLCSAVRCCGVLCCALLCFAVLAVLCCAVLCCAVSPPPSPLLFLPACLPACLPSPSPPPFPPPARPSPAHILFRRSRM